MKNLPKIIMYVILAVSVVSMVLLFVMRGSDGAFGRDSGNFAEFNGLDIMLWWAYILLVFGILAAIVMSIVNAGKNPSGDKMALYGVIVLAVVLVASYLLSSNDPVPVSGGKSLYTNNFGLRVTDMGLYTAYFAMIAAVGAVIWGGIKNSFK
jgi:TRAP-type C4-dicarboxylate transport system permease small subunit